MVNKLEMYHTPIPFIREGLRRFFQWHKLKTEPKTFLEPGTSFNAPFCHVIKQRWPDIKTFGIDLNRTVRKPQFVDYYNYGDFTKLNTNLRFDVIAMNPPFSLGEEFVRKAIQLLSDEGALIVLQRIQWLGGQARAIGIHKEIFPSYICYCSQRVSFTGDGKVDRWDVAFFCYLNESQTPTRAVIELMPPLHGKYN